MIKLPGKEPNPKVLETQVTEKEKKHIETWLQYEYERIPLSEQTRILIKDNTKKTPPLKVSILIAWGLNQLTLDEQKLNCNPMHLQISSIQSALGSLMLDRKRPDKAYWARGYKTFFMLTSAEQEILLLKNVKMPTFVVILTFMSRKNSILSLSEPDKS